MKQTVSYWRMVVVLAFALVGWKITDHIFDAKQAAAVCAVLSKHIPNRDPQIVNGECTMLVGVGNVRVRMPVVEYGELILEDEQ